MYMQADERDKRVYTRRNSDGATSTLKNVTCTVGNAIMMTMRYAANNVMLYIDPMFMLLHR